MKTKFLFAFALAGAMGAGFLIHSDQALAATPTSPGAGTPPVGRTVDITLVAGLPSNQAAEKINGTLVAMQSDWIIVSEGSYEHWIPTSKVMEMRASR